MRRSRGEKPGATGRLSPIAPGWRERREKPKGAARAAPFYAGCVRRQSVVVAAMQLAERGIQLLTVAVVLVAEDRLRATDRLVRRGGDELLAVGVVGATAVAHRDIELAVGPEGQVAAVVVELRPGYADELSRERDARRGRAARVGGNPLDNHVVMVGVQGRRPRGRDRRHARVAWLRRVGVEAALARRALATIEIRIEREP